MKINKKQMEILEDNFKIYEYDDSYELEKWTNGGVDMFILVYKSDENGTLIEQFGDYINCFDIDEEIEIYRQDKNYRENFTIRESVHDFEEWIETIKNIIKELKESESE